MGAWGAGPLDNDEASDFVGDIVDGELDLAFLDSLIEADYIEADAGEILLAAASIVIAERTGSPAPAGVDARAFVSDLGDERIAALRQQLERVVGGGEESELYQLWDESGNLDEWLAPAKELVAQLG